MKKLLFIFTVLLLINANAAIDKTKWQYDSDNQVYYQTSINYCSGSENNRELAIYVPESSMKCKKGKCKIKGKKRIVAMPLDKATKGYKNYTDNGIIYVDINNKNDILNDIIYTKAAIKYLKKELKTNKIFVAGNTEAAVIGVSAKSKFYKPYLKELKSTGKNDIAYGIYVYSPVINSQSFDLMKGWNSNGNSAEAKKLARDYAFFVNKFRFEDESGNLLIINRSKDGKYNEGSYIKYVNNFKGINKKLGSSNIEKSKTYSPLSYLMKPYTTKFTKHWLIKYNFPTTDEINLYLALKNNKKVKSVDFQSQKSFIDWMKECLK